VRNLTALAQAAVGFDASRGDLLTVEDLPFDENRSQQPPSALGQFMAAAEGSPVLVKYAALLAGLLLIVAFGLRPVVRRAAAQAGGRESKELEAHSAVSALPVLKPPEPAEADPERLRNQEIFEQVTGHLKREPTQSSRLLQSWIHSD